MDKVLSEKTYKHIVAEQKQFVKRIADVEMVVLETLKELGSLKALVFELKENFSEEKKEAIQEDMIEEVCFRIADKYGFLFEKAEKAVLNNIKEMK